MPRVLPEWMLKAKPPKNIVFLPSAQYFRESVDHALMCVEILSLPRKMRCDLYGEDRNEPFHFFRNCGVSSVLDIADALEVMVVMKGVSYADEYEHWDDASAIAVELSLCLHLFELQFAPLFVYIDSPSKYLILGST